MNKQQRDILVGSLLGDGSITQPNNNKTARIQICQSVKQMEWVFHKYELIKDLVNTPPQIRNVKYPTCYFNTKTLPTIYELYEMFVSQGRKGVPQNIKELLTEQGVAVWYGDDGFTTKPSTPHLKNRNPHGYFCTDSFTRDEVDLLRETLLEKFQIDTGFWSPPSAKGRCRIYVKTSSFSKLVDVIEPFLPPTMQYKLGR